MLTDGIMYTLQLTSPAPLTIETETKDKVLIGRGFRYRQI
jgi:hypothetical protein